MPAEADPLMGVWPLWPPLLSGAMTLLDPVVTAQSCPEDSEALFMIADQLVCLFFLCAMALLQTLLASG